MTFCSFGLREDILENLAKLGFEKSTKIQALAIPEILDGHDVIACAQTGTGKTAAFSLPILQKITDIKRETKDPRVLVLAPTRELAFQVNENINDYAKGMDTKTVVIYGGVDYGPQTKRLRAGVDIVVATPGRLLDHMGRDNINISAIEYLVIDEADRMLDMGFLPDIKRIVKKLPKKRQTVFFSATFSEDILEEAGYILNNPKKIEAQAANSAAAKVKHILHPVDGDKKSALLAYLIGSTKNQQALVFTRTKKACDALSKEILKDGIRNMVIHGDRTQAYRSKALRFFKEKKIQVLVATDIAARGLDIEKLPIVVNYELPNVAEDYVHRVGRTGRAGMDGLAITLMTDQELYRLAQIEELTGLDIEHSVVEGFEPVKFKPELLTRESREMRSGKTARNRARRHAFQKSKTDNKDRRKRTSSGTNSNKKASSKKTSGKKTFKKAPSKFKNKRRSGR